MTPGPASLPSPSPPPPRPQRWGMAGGPALALLLLVSACGGDVDATDYTAENREAFLTACTLPGEDPNLIRDVCECTYEQIEANIAFGDFVGMEESLQFDALNPLPDSVTALMAECFVAEVDL